MKTYAIKDWILSFTPGRTFPSSVRVPFRSKSTYSTSKFPHPGISIEIMFASEFEFAGGESTEKVSPKKSTWHSPYDHLYRKCRPNRPCLHPPKTPIPSRVRRPKVIATSSVKKTVRIAPLLPISFHRAAMVARQGI